MKKYLLYLFILTGTFSYAQDNYQPADSAATWTGRGLVPAAGMTWWMNFFIPETDYDTLIGTESYSKMYMQYSPETSFYFCSFRTDTTEKTIYVIPKDSTEEFLYFDFDAPNELDDTITLTHSRTGGIDDEWTTNEFRIELIDSVEIEGEYYTSWTMTPVESGEFYQIGVMERLISVSFPFTIQYFFETQLELKCYSENGIPFYSSWCPFSYEEFLPTTGITRESNLENQVLTLYPNPNTGQFTLNNESNEVGQFIIYSIQGQEITRFQLDANSQEYVNLELAAGTYPTIFLTETGTFTSKLVIQ